MALFPVYVAYGNLNNLNEMFNQNLVPFRDDNPESETSKFNNKMKLIKMTLGENNKELVIHSGKFSLTIHQTPGNCNSLSVIFGSLSFEEVPFVTYILKNLASMTGNNVILGSHIIEYRDVFLENKWNIYLTMPSIRGYSSPVCYMNYILNPDEMATKGFIYLSNKRKFLNLHVPVAKKADAEVLKTSV